MNLFKTAFSVLAIVAGLSAMAAPADPPVKDPKAEPAKKIWRPNYWYIGLEGFTPMIFDDLYSITNEGKAAFGPGAQLKAGYQFSPVFSLEASFGLGYNRALPNAFQSPFWLGMRDAYTYYPYTLIDGTTYYIPFEEPDGELLVGEQGQNFEKVTLEGTPFPDIESRIFFWRGSINAAFNLTRLFYAGDYTEKVVELWLRPGAYLSKFTSKVYNTTSGEIAAVEINSPVTWGFGGDAALRFNVTKRFSIDLTNRVIWQRDHAVDGIISAKQAYDTYMWEPSIGLVYKFRGWDRPDEPGPVPAPPVVPVLTPRDLLGLDYWYPEVPAPEAPKVLKHSRDVFLTFLLNKTYLVPDLHDNPRELAIIRKEVKEYINNPAYNIKSIFVEGFASPEGPYDNNLRLGQGRAQTILNYIASLSQGVTRDKIRIGRTTENWSGLRDTLQANPSLPGAKAVLALLDREPDTEIVKQQIKKIDGYKYLLENVYPRLRRSTYTIEYETKVVAGKSAMEKYRLDPRSLTVAELYSVIAELGFTTREAEEPIKLLHELFPSHPLTMGYDGVTALDRDDFDTAISLLSAIPAPTPEVLNALGVAYAYKGRNDEAREALSKAAAGSEYARTNLRTLLRIIDRK